MRTSRSYLFALAGALLVTSCISSHSGGTTGGGRGGAGGGDGDGTVPTTIAQALALVPGTGWDTDSALFSDVKKVVALNGGLAANGPLGDYIGIGAGSYSLGPRSALFEVSDFGDKLGFDPYSASASIAVGTAPRVVTSVYGDFEPATVGAKLSKLGYAQHGTAAGGAVWGYDGNVPTSFPGMHALLVSPTRIVLGTVSADVETIAGAVGAPVTSSSSMDAVANCLGPALSAVIGPQSQGQSQSRNPSLLGVGLLADTAQDASEEVCVTVSSAAQAAAVSAAWTSGIRFGYATDLHMHWSSLLTDPQATTLNAVDGVTTVRLTAKPSSGRHVGTVLELYYGSTTDFDVLIGTQLWAGG